MSTSTQIDTIGHSVLIVLAPNGRELFSSPEDPVLADFGKAMVKREQTNILLLIRRHSLV